MNYLPYVLPLSSQGPRVTALFFFSSSYCEKRPFVKALQIT